LRRRVGFGLGAPPPPMARLRAGTARRVPFDIFIFFRFLRLLG